MHRDGQHPTRVVKRVLGPVPVVNVVVNYSHTVEFTGVLFKGTLEGNGDVSKDAESVAVFLFGVVARWSDKSVRVLDFSGEQSVQSGNGSAGSQLGNLVAAFTKGSSEPGGSGRIFGVSAGGRRQFLDGLDV